MSDDEELPDLRYVRELARVFKQYGLDEIEIEAAGQRIFLRRGTGGEVGSGPVVASAPAPGAAMREAPVPAPPAAPAAPPAPRAGEFLTSPFVGTFYSAPRPDTPPFVQAGDRVAQGQTICIIEAMKLFNEIEAEFPCIVEETLVENAQPVEYGAKLFRVRRL